MDFTSCLSTNRRLELLEEEDNSDSEEINKTEAIKRRSAEWTKILLEKETGSFLFEWCQTKLFTKGMIILRECVRQTKGKQFLDSLEQIWNFFFQEILSLLQAIFLPLTVRKQGHTIRKAALVCFRDVIILKLDVLSAFEAVNFKVSAGIKQMFLILQSVHDTNPPNSNRLELEKLVARIIIPYLGYRGYYEGESEPTIESREPALASQRKSIADARRISRPLSVQPVQYERLTDLFHSAISRTSSLNSDD